MRKAGVQMATVRLTEGNVWGTIVRFAVPFLLANLFQALYGAADLFMVGRFSDSAGVSAVATGGQVMQTITGLAVGLTTGGTVLIGRHYGARQGRQTADAVKTALVLFGLLSLAMMAGTLWLLDEICAMMQVPHQALESTRAYLYICALGIPAIMDYNAVSAILRGLGDSHTPLLFIAVACAGNIALDFYLVGIRDLGAPGAAIATVMAQTASLALIGLYLWRRGNLRQYRRKRPQLRAAAARQMLAAGLPIAVQDGLVNVSFLILTALINHMGLTESASVGVVEKLIVFSMLPTTAIASAIAGHHSPAPWSGLYGARPTLPGGGHFSGAGLWRRLLCGGAAGCTCPGRAVFQRSAGHRDRRMVSACLQFRLRVGLLCLLPEHLFFRRRPPGLSAGPQSDFHRAGAHPPVMVSQPPAAGGSVSHRLCCAAGEPGVAGAVRRLPVAKRQTGTVIRSAEG